MAWVGENICILQSSGHASKVMGAMPGRTCRSPMSISRNVADNLAEVRERIASAARRAGRQPGEVALMAVSKTHPASAILEAMAAGQLLFGENRVQEFAGKYEELKAAGMGDARFHLIGHLQSNKVARAAELFDAIDSVDSLRLGERLNEASIRLGHTRLGHIQLGQGAQSGRLEVLIEVNIGGEAGKSGIDPASDELQAVLEAHSRWSALAIRGLMAVPPITPEPESARPYFRRLRELRDRLRARSGLPLPELSMGMSHDFEVAIEEGSTCVRIGTAIFGARPHPAAEERPG